jgi:hypothetical protein
MDHSAMLQTLPETIAFPTALKERIRYEPARKRLVFSGFMTKSEYDQLTRLHNDVGYQRAVERLFQLSAEQDSPQFRRVLRVLAVLVALCLILGAVVWWQLLRTPRVPSSDDADTSRAEQRVEKGVLNGSLPGTVHQAGTTTGAN